MSTKTRFEKEAKDNSEMAYTRRAGHNNPSCFLRLRRDE